MEKGEKKMHIKDEVIEQIKNANDIVDVISSYLNLEKKGSTYYALCPFHNEKTASFTVSEIKQSYYCFGCGIGGDVIQFIMDYTQVSFVDSVKNLAQRAGLESLLEKKQNFERKRIFLKRKERSLLQLSKRNHSCMVSGVSQTYPKKKAILRNCPEKYVYGEKIKDPFGQLFPDKDSQKDFLMNRCNDLIEEYQTKIEEDEILLTKLKEKELCVAVLMEERNQILALKQLKQKIERM